MALNRPKFFNKNTGPQRPAILCVASLPQSRGPSRISAANAAGTLLPKQKMKMTDIKNDCIESITRVLERCSVWRKSLAARFPEDGRNLRASHTLENLAVDAANMSDEQFSTLASHYGWASEKWRAALNDTARGIGFHIRTKQFDIFLKALLQRLTPVVSVAA